MATCLMERGPTASEVTHVWGRKQPGQGDLRAAFSTCILYTKHVENCASTQYLPQFEDYLTPSWGDHRYILEQRGSAHHRTI